MKPEDKTFEIVMLIAFAKLLSDQSTHLQNELNGIFKHDFNVMVRRADDFIKRWESNLGDGNNDTLQQITDALNDKVADIRKQILELK